MEAEEKRREWVRREFRASIRLLSLPGEEQLAALPEGCCKAE